MDEPQLSNAMEVSDEEKNNLDEVLNEAALSTADIDKPMDVDESGDLPSTSDAHEVTNQPEEEEKIESQNEEITDEPVDEKSPVAEEEQPPASVENAEELDSTLQPEQTLNESNFDETFQSKQSESYDYTEKSINISQISVDQNNDSNDAFDALKLSESNVLDQSKETDTFEKGDVSMDALESTQQETKDEQPESEDDDSNARDETTAPDDNSAADNQPETTDLTDDVQGEQGDSPMETDQQAEDQADQQVVDQIEPTDEHHDEDEPQTTETGTDAMPEEQSEEGDGTVAESGDRVEEPEEGKELLLNYFQQL